MGIYQKNTSVGGAWVKKEQIVNGTGVKIVSETNPEPSPHQNKDGSVKFQDVCKVKFDGTTDSVKVALNRATINALVDAFGEDSRFWQNKPLTVETEKMRVAGKAVIALYLIPQGYKRVDDADGYATIVKEGEEPEKTVTEDEIPL